MKYYLNIPGKKAVEMSLDELRRQREAGQLHGTELVWSPGMPEWVPLDVLLQQGPRAGQGPPAIPVAPRGRLNFIVISLVALAVVAAVGFVGFVGYRAAKRFRALRAQMRNQ